MGAAAHLQVFAGLRRLTWGCEHFGPQILQPGPGMQLVWHGRPEEKRN
jgi:hypothetical protein